MQIKILKTKSKTVKEFNEKEWNKANKEHFNCEIDWSKEKYRLVAYKENELIGTMSLEIQAGVTHIDALIVSSKHRREGIGKELMQKAEDIANEHQSHKIFLETGRGWKSQRFYENLGYKITGELKEHYFKKDFVILTKYLRN